MKKFISIVLIIVTCAIVGGCVDSNTGTNKQQTQQKKQNDPKESIKQVAGDFITAFLKKDHQGLHNNMNFEKRVLKNVDIDKLLDEDATIINGSIDAQAQITGIKPKLIFTIDNINIIDDSHAQFTWNLKIGKETISVPDITMVKINNAWKVDVESFGVVMMQTFNG